jgi:uncharacterized YccA/Bax inhibitor family protein
MANPVFNQKALEKATVLEGEPMTVNGAINKTFILFALLLTASVVVWDAFFKGYADKAMMLGIIGFVTSIISFIAFMITKNAVAAGVYAISEGLVLGGISAMFEKSYPGIAIQAISATFMALFSMLFLYRIGAIKCTEKFRSTIMISTMSIAGIYLIEIIGSFFGMHVPQIMSSSNIGIIFSLIVIVIASLNLIIDFDFIEQGAQRMLGKNYEWYGAFGLMVTLVWLYLEMLRLFAKLRNR